MPNVPILGEDDAVLEDDGDGAILLKGALGNTWDIRDTSLADGHAPKSHLRRELESTGEDLGGGFVMQDTPVLVQRGPSGEIVRTTPLSEVPGVSYTAEGMTWDTEPELQEEVPTPAPLSRDDRNKLVTVLTLKLFKYYRQMPPTQAKYNPFYDGIPDVPAGSPEHLQPLPGTKLYPATEGQIFEWLRRFVGQRTQVINKNKFGKDNLQDLSIRIE